MRTVYAVRVAGPDPSLRPRAQALVEAWLAERFPYDGSSAGTAVRPTVEPSWFRVVVDQHIDADLTSQITIAMRTDRRGLEIEVRQAFVPRVVRVTRRVPPPRDMTLLRLVARLVELVGAVDAGVAISSAAQVVRDPLAAAGVVALCDAPSRTLPVIIESMAPSGEPAFRAGAVGRAAAGLAHVVVLADDAARRAFNEAWGTDLLPPAALLVMWPGKGDMDPPRSGVGLTPQGAQRVLVDVLEGVIAAAAASLPMLPRPRPERSQPSVASAGAVPSVGTNPATTDLVTTDPVRTDLVRTDAIPAVVDPDALTVVDGAVADGAFGDVATGEPMVTMQELLGVLDELEEAWDRVDDLQGALAAADAMVAAANARAELSEARIDDLVRNKVELEIRLGGRPDTLSASSPTDAVAQARLLCRHLAFVGDDKGLVDLDGIDPTALLIDLVKLDSVAAQWNAGAITDTTFSLACRNVGLDFATDVSDTARNEYAQDYTIVWQGRAVLAGAHVRRGKGVHHYRIHLYLDRDRRRVVVGHIGRHLRGKKG